MSKVLTFEEVEVGNHYKINGSGYVNIAGVYAYEQSCAKDGDLLTVTSKGRTINDVPYVYTTAGAVYNALATFTPIEADKDVIKTLNRIVAGPGIVLGTDPEFFIVHGDGAVFPAWEFLPKQDKNQTVMEFWDGFQAEMTVYPESCISWLADSMMAGLKRALDKARQVDPTARLHPVGVLDIPFEVMQSTHPKYTELGCAPSVNAYGDPPLMVENPRDLPFRFAGFHVHASTDRYGLRDKDALVRVIDEVYGLPSISLLAGLDDPRRRQFYGKAGEYRSTSYGIEYRVPSGVNLAHPILVHLTFNMVRTGIKAYQVGINDLWGIGQEEVRRIINENDVDAARQVLRDNDFIFQTLMSNVYHDTDGGFDEVARMAHRLVTEGAVNLLNDLDNAEKAWLMGNWTSHSEGNNASMRNLFIDANSGG